MYVKKECAEILTAEKDTQDKVAARRRMNVLHEHNKSDKSILEKKVENLEIILIDKQGKRFK